MLLGGLSTWWFFFVASILAVYTHFGTVIIVFAAFLALDAFVQYRQSKIPVAIDGQSKIPVVPVAINGILFVGIVIWWALADVKIDTVHFTVTYVVGATVILHLAHTVIQMPADHANKAMRILAFKTGIGASLVIMAQIFVEISTVINNGVTLANSTHQSNTTLCGKKTEGIIFNVNTNYSMCPDRLWKIMRINLLFATQVYTLYMLTTATHVNLVHTDNGTVTSSANKDEDETNKSRPFVIGLAAIVECVALTAAVATHFDVIRDCHIVTTNDMVLILISLLAHKARVLYIMPKDTTEKYFTNYVQAMQNDLVSSKAVSIPYFRQKHYHVGKLKL